MSVYPAELDSLQTDVEDRDESTSGNPKPGKPEGSGFHADLHNEVNAAVVAIETALGINPQGESATVAARLTALAAVLTAIEAAAAAETAAREAAVKGEKEGREAGDAGEAKAREEADALLQPTAQKGQANGYASLDGGGKVPVTQLPSSLMELKGVWDAEANSPKLKDGAGDVGDVYLVSKAGTQDLGSGAQTFAVGDWVILNSSKIWQQSDTTQAVASVNGKTGVVELTPADVGADAEGAADEERERAEAAEAGKVPTSRKVNGHELTGNIEVTKSDVGLGKADNTSDAEKNEAAATLKNKRVEPRVLTIESSAEPAINTDEYDAVTITKLATAITSMSAKLTGTPTNFQKFIFRIKDNGTARAITWGSSFASRGATLPTTTVAGKFLSVGVIYNAAAKVFDCVAVAQGE